MLHTQNKKSKKVKKFNNSGFTLIELLVVISVISLLSSILLVSVSKARLGGRDSNRVANITQVKNALDLYYGDNNTYPSGTYYSGWDAGNYPGSDAQCWCQSTTTSSGFETALVKNGNYIAKLPQDPVSAEGNGNFLVNGLGKGYLYVSDGQNYVLGTYLEASNILPPATNSTSSCAAAGNYQISYGSLDPSLCPTTYVPGGGGSGPGGSTTLSISPTYPLITGNNSSLTALSYNASTELYTINALPSAMLFTSAGPPKLISSGSLAINVKVDNTGKLVGSGTGSSDLIITGSVTSPGGAVYNGTLLTGNVIAFGYSLTGSTPFQVEFQITGGSLANGSVFTVGNKVGATISTLNSTFNGTFTNGFTAGVNFNLGTVN